MTLVVVGAPAPECAVVIADGLRLLQDEFRRAGKPVPEYLRSAVVLDSSPPVAARSRQHPPVLDDAVSDADRRGGEHDLVDYREAARQLDLGLRTVERLVAAGEIPTCRVGRSVRFRQEDLQRFAERRIA